MPLIDFVSVLHKKTVRDYKERVCVHDKIECATVAKRYGRDYWDGDRSHGYGGYRYDGRWEPVARAMIEHYGLRDGMSLLDVGCGKAHLLHEFKKLLPGLEVRGVDISRWGLDTAKEEVRPFLTEAPAQELPFADNSFDLVISLATFHNLKVFELKRAIDELNRVAKDPARSYVMLESYRNEAERVNLMFWQLTCESFYSVEEWEWLYAHFGFKGDYSFIFFE
ncbi:23S rRNA (guanine(745)-N(1))-methyltransferase [Fundidesulfovibrio magnetotacticus]|uniref:23S rRNA (Guanine(745)-N(1))-methyltransferase n=1 Tax=Fundidesulfovibrio magnetotacticus TaxID=2730080 RepID=A0A6V8LZ84_9BACT|nr:class I SAM-dependent methyltransferase [Fundidesulfovibrio magnetotacticus]GFK94957.1 23S rRNA (guanine(745)-N(1))-methyltransferase [Fundidesulfovibrio magnetotacticus]